MERCCVDLIESNEHTNTEEKTVKILQKRRRLFSPSEDMINKKGRWRNNDKQYNQA